MPDVIEKGDGMREQRAVEVLREIAGPTRTAIRERRDADRARHHDPALYRDPHYFCPGCWWCAADENVGDRRARAALRAAGEDY